MKTILETGEKVRSAVINISERIVLVWYTFAEPNILKAIELPNDKIDTIEKVQSYMGDIILTEIRSNMYRKRWTITVSDSSRKDKVSLYNHDKEIECDIWYILEASKSTSVESLLKLIHEISKAEDNNRIHIKVLKDSIEFYTDKYVYNITKSGDSEVQIQIKEAQDNNYKKENTRTIKNIEYDDLVNLVRHIILKIEA